METIDIRPPKPPKRQLKVYLDHRVFREVRGDHVERDIPMSHVIEEILARHYEIETPSIPQST